MTFVHTAWEYRPVGITAAQMNMFYGLSVMAQRRNVSAGDYADDTIADPDILAFIPRIKVAVDPEIEGKGPALRHAARVNVRTADGRSHSRDVWHRRGSPENPVSRGEVEEKFAANVDGLLGADQARRLRSLAGKLEALPDATEIIAIMAQPVSS
jgi:2-methylcitrate dehydratase PrpD